MNAEETPGTEIPSQAEGLAATDPPISPSPPAQPAASEIQALVERIENLEDVVHSLGGGVYGHPGHDAGALFHSWWKKMKEEVGPAPTEATPRRPSFGLHEVIGGPPLDLGGGHRIEWYAPFANGDPGLSPGGVIYHPRPGGKECGASFWLPGSRGATPGHTWYVASLPGAPLSLSPSFQCHCGYHGFVQDGKWIRA
jgi:hypothetical protein